MVDSREDIKKRVESYPELSENYREILNYVLAIDEATDEFKSNETALKENVAAAQSLYKKDGTTLDLSKVKMPILIGAIEVSKGLDDKLAEKYDIQEEYVSMIKQNDIESGPIKSYLDSISFKKERVTELKDAENHLKTKIDSDIVACLVEIAKEEAKLIKESNMENPPKEKVDAKGLDSVQILKVLREKFGIR
ncbi:MAG TPA: hypothetical protein EYG89_01295 [Bacteroidia bacterium]|nr:hypothetical protein [Bacteroidia bacterium]